MEAEALGLPGLLFTRTLSHAPAAGARSGSSGSRVFKSSGQKKLQRSYLPLGFEGKEEFASGRWAEEGIPESGEGAGR